MGIYLRENYCRIHWPGPSVLLYCQYVLQERPALLILIRVFVLILWHLVSVDYMDLES